jgi:hypothetical protein
LNKRMYSCLIVAFGGISRSLTLISRLLVSGSYIFC